MRWALPWLVGAVVASSGCHVIPGAGRGGGALAERGDPWLVAQGHRKKAERALADGRVDDALRWLDRACGYWPSDVRAYRLRQDVRVGRGELAAVLKQARLEVRLRDDALSWYLLGRVLPAGEDQRRAFARASERDPAFAWGHYGMGVVQFRRRRLSAAAAGLRSARSRFDVERESDARETATIMLARVLDAQLDREGAEALLDAAEREFPESAAPVLARAAMADRDGEVKKAFALAERALHLRDGAAGAAVQLERLLRIHGTPADYVRVGAALRKAPAPKSGRWQRLAGRVALEAEAWAAAEAAYREALALGVPAVELAAERRLLAIRTGDPAAALAAEQTLVPKAMALSPNNSRAGRYALLYATCQAWANVGASPETQIRFAEAALRAGWIEEGRWVARALADAADTPAAVRPRAVALLRELEGYDGLIERLRQGLDAGYRAERLGESPIELEPFLGQLGAWAKAHLPKPWNRDLSAGTQLIRFALIGELIDPVPPPPGTPPSRICGLQRYFLEEWNHHLLLGRRNGQPPEATLLRVASWDPAAQRALWGEPVRYGVLHGEARALESLREHQGAEIGGAAFSAGFYVELVAAGRTIAGQRSVARLDAAAKARVAAIAAPAAEDAGTAMALFNDPALRAALILRSGGAATAAGDSVEWHELAHVVDARRMLPLTKHPADVLRWLARSNFSLRRAEARLEEHAYWAALAHSRDPHHVLAELIGFLPERNSGPPHSQAAYDLLDTLCRWAWRHGGVDRRRVILHQFLHWPPERLREAARAGAKQRGFEAAGGW